MPTYDYQCCKCKHVQEERHRMTENPVITCKRCKEYVCNRIPSCPNVTEGPNGGEISSYGDIHEYKPKWLRFKDGHRERYDPTKHGHRKGRGR